MLGGCNQLEQAKRIELSKISRFRRILTLDRASLGSLETRMQLAYRMHRVLQYAT